MVDTVAGISTSAGMGDDSVRRQSVWEEDGSREQMRRWGSHPGFATS